MLTLGFVLNGKVILMASIEAIAYVTDHTMHEAVDTVYRELTKPLKENGEVEH